MAQKISNADIKLMAYAVASQLIISALDGQMIDNLAADIAAGNTEIAEEDLDDVTVRIINAVSKISDELNDRAESFGGFF